MDKALIEFLQTKVPDECIFADEPMDKHTTFRVGGCADCYVEIGKVEELSAIIKYLKQTERDYFVLGNGSNVLFGDKGFRGLVLHLGRRFSDIQVKDNTIRAQAGAMLTTVARTAWEHALTGMEFAAGIPGTVGGAVVMNAGAYGGEMKDVLETVTVLTRDGDVKTLKKEELELGYRTSVIAKKGYIVLSAVIRLENGKKEEIKAVMDDLKEKRITKQPLEYPSAGSTFKRPEGYFAGKLIQDAGLRGFQVGGAQVSEKHCGFVVNKDQATAADDDKIDIFLSETDYVFKYTDKDADVAMPLEDLGINCDEAFADQYDFTRTTASDSDGVQRGSTWQCCPGLLVYRRDIAMDVFGTDDPEEIGEKTKDWDTLKATAAELKEKGYYTFSSYADTFRLYGNSIDESWVQPGSDTVVVDKKITNWVNDSKEWLDAGYVDANIKGQWNDDWNKAMGSESKVFAFLFPAWGIDFTLAPNWDGAEGSWAVTTPPQEYNWGGSYIHAATGTDNPEYVKDIILAMTADKDNLLKISKDYSDFTNTKSGMQEAATDDSFASDFLGGQNPFAYFAPVAENIKIAPLSAYDQGCVELIQNSFSDYLQGNVDYDKAKANFETAIEERYPDIKQVTWPE